MIRNDIRIGDFINKGESLTSYKFIVDLDVIKKILLE